MDLFQPAAPMRMAPLDPHDDLVGNRFVDALPADVALFGLPFDGAVIGRKGAKDGPTQIRAELRRLKSPLPARWIDLGDAKMPADPREAGEVAFRAMRTALATTCFPVALGGDHSLTYGLVKAARESIGPVAVLNLDAHLDVREATTVNSGTSFRRLIDEQIVQPEWVFEAGLRWFANSSYYIAWAKKAGINLWGADQIRASTDWEFLRKIHEAFHEAPPMSRPKGLYVSLDMDVLDETAASGVSAPTPGGLPTSRLFEIMRALAGSSIPILALDVVETAPSLDRDNQTARAAAWAILNLVAYRSKG